MAHVYEGEPDARQAGDIAPSRFRPQYRALTDEEKATHDRIKAKAAELESLFDECRALVLPAPVLEALPAIADGQMHEAELGFSTPDSRHRYFDDGMTALELAVMWTVKELTA